MSDGRWMNKERRGLSEEIMTIWPKEWRKCQGKNKTVCKDDEDVMK